MLFYLKTVLEAANFLIDLFKTKFKIKRLIDKYQ